MILTNVTNIGDPQIVRSKEEYFMYATSFDPTGFHVWKSKDLENWQDLGVCLDMRGGWAEGSFWAPEAVFHGGRYAMHFTARRKSDRSLRIGVAFADSPEGPFVQPRNEPMFDFGYAAIDGHVFIDDDGTKYFYYSRDCSENVVGASHTSHIYVVKLNDTLDGVCGEAKFLIGAEKPFETDGDGSWLWNEGPAVLKRDGKYFLFYSANYYASRRYCICVATSDYPDRDFIKDESRNPVLQAKDGEGISGPGHNSFFFDSDGNLKTAFHIHTFPEAPSDNRRACIADVTYRNGRFEIVT